jgi:hypothetical protein
LNQYENQLAPTGRKADRMNDRWLPVLAAILGVLGGVAGAAVGGYVANKGQEQRFAEERAARIRDLRIQTYVTFLRAAENEHSNAPRVEDAIVLTADAEVALVARSAALRRAAAMLTESALFFDPERDIEYTQARERFVELAHEEIAAGA